MSVTSSHSPIPYGKSTTCPATTTTSSAEKNDSRGTLSMNAGVDDHYVMTFKRCLLIEVKVKRDSGIVALKLTLNSQLHSFADRRRHTVGRHTQIGSHMQSANFGDLQQFAVDHIHCVTMTMDDTSRIVIEREVSERVRSGAKNCNPISQNTKQTDRPARCLPFSPPIAISSPSSRRHMT